MLDVKLWWNIHWMRQVGPIWKTHCKVYMTQINNSYKLKSIDSHSAKKVVGKFFVNMQ